MTYIYYKYTLYLQTFTLIRYILQIKTTYSNLAGEGRTRPVHREAGTFVNAELQLTKKVGDS